MKDLETKHHTLFNPFFFSNQGELGAETAKRISLSFYFHLTANGLYFHIPPQFQQMSTTTVGFRNNGFSSIVRLFGVASVLTTVSIKRGKYRL